MKKLFLTSLCGLAIAFATSFGIEDQSLIANEAFAGGGCCNETDSICGLAGRNTVHFYYQSSGPCGSTGGGGTISQNIQ